MDQWQKLFAGYNDEGYLIPLDQHVLKTSLLPLILFFFVFLELGRPSWSCVPAPGNHLPSQTCRTEPRNLSLPTLTGSEEQEASFSPMSHKLTCCQLPGTKRVTLREWRRRLREQKPSFNSIRPCFGGICQRAKPHSAAAVKSIRKRCTPRDEGHQFQIRNTPDNFTPPTRRKRR